MIFLDSNVLVYAYDRSEKDKHKKAQDILLECWNTRSGVVSTQVLQEFYVTVTRKLSKKLSKQAARETIEELSVWSIYQPLVADIIAASELEEKHSLSFWDALIVIAAQNSGADTLISEDLQDKQQIGSVKVVNPFK